MTMALFYIIVGSLLALSAADVSSKERHEFIQAMQEVEMELQMKRQEEDLQDRLLSAAEKLNPDVLRRLRINRSLQNNGDSNWYYFNGENRNDDGGQNQYQDYQAYQEYQNAQQQYQNAQNYNGYQYGNQYGNNGNQYANNGNQYGNNGNQYDQQDDQQQNVDDYYQEGAEENNAWYDQNMYYDNEEGREEYRNYDFGFRSSSGVDLTNYALKYVGCQNIHTWSDEQVEMGNVPMVMKRYVILRLCEANMCSAYNRYGCSFHYGEYVLPMETYLGIVMNFHLEQFTRYCTTCSQCMSFDYSPYEQEIQQAAYQQQGYGNNGADDDNAGDDATDDNHQGVDYWWKYVTGYFTDDDDYYSAPTDDWAAADDDSNGRNLQYNYYNNGENWYNQRNYDQNYGYYAGNDNGDADGNAYQYDGEHVVQLPWYVNRYGQCVFESVCANYKRTCRSYNENAANYQTYFQCSQFSIGNRFGYLGPHCRSDGKTIGIGFFSDANCNEFVKDVDFSEYTSLSFDDDELAPFYDNTCISCKASESYSLVSDKKYSGGTKYTYPLCGALYDNSAKCHKHFSSGNSLFISEEDQQDRVCPFIESIAENNYDEAGDVIVSPQFQLDRWRSTEQYINLARRASTLQQVLLTASILLTLLLLISVCRIRRKLKHRTQWQQKLTYGENDQDSSGKRNISRVNSGIGAARSMSYDQHSVSQTQSGGIVHGDLSYPSRASTRDDAPAQGAFA